MGSLLPWAAGAAETLVKVLLGVAVVGFMVLAWRLVRQPPGRAIGHTARDLAIASALAIIVVLTLLTPSDPDETQQIVLRPFADLIDALGHHRNLRSAIFELIGNLILFMPLGMALRWRFASFGIGAVTVICMLVSVTVEVIQALSGMGRWADITDVIMNTLGGLVGAIIAGAVMVEREPPPRT